MTNTKQFHFSDLLTITTGRTISTRHTDGIYDILNHMTNDSLFTHQLCRAADECKPWLLKWFPELSEADAFIPDLDSLMKQETPKNACSAWLGLVSRSIKKLKPFYDVGQIPADSHARINPLVELQEMKPGTENIIVKID